jgi:hypothetical protein
LRRAATRPISGAMNQRATERPHPFHKPPHWSDSPAPEPGEPAEAAEELSPTRYGDWVKQGIAIDF